MEGGISNARTGREKAEAALMAARRKIEAEQNNTQTLLQKTETSEAALRQQRESLAGLEASLTNVERALAEKESRLEVLKQLNEEGEGLAQGSQAILKGLDNAAKFDPL